MKTTKQSRVLQKAFLLGVALYLLTLSTAIGQIPAWGDWQRVGLPCGGVQLYVALSKDDGKNDFEVKTKLINTNSYKVQTRFESSLESVNGDKVFRKAGGPINAGREIGACPTFPSFCFGSVFPGSVVSSIPVAIADFAVSRFDVANLSAPISKKPASAYLDPFRDYPTTSCSDLRVDFERPVPSSFIWDFQGDSSMPDNSGGTQKYSRLEKTVIERGILNQNIKVRTEFVYPDRPSDISKATVDSTVSISDLDPDVRVNKCGGCVEGIKFSVTLYSANGTQSINQRLDDLNGVHDEKSGQINLSFKTEEEANNAATSLRKMISRSKKL